MAKRIVAIGLLVLLGAGSAQPADGEGGAPFEILELHTAYPVVQDVLALRLGDTPARHLVAVTRPEGGAPQLELFAPDARGRPATPPRRVALPDDVLALDAAESTGEKPDALYFLTPSAILRWDPSAGIVREREVRSIYRAPIAGSLMQLDFVRVVTGASLVVLPDFEAVHVGSARLPLSPRAWYAEGSMAYRPAELGFADWNLDGTPDAFFFDDDTLHWFPGRSDGFGPAVAQSLGLGLTSLQEGELGDVDLSDRTTRRVLDVADFDADGVPDLLVQSSHQSGLLDRTSHCDLHLGIRGPEGTLLPTTPSSRVEAGGPLGEIQALDLDGDGRRDLVASQVEVGVGAITSALIRRSVEFETRFFRLTPEGRFPEAPDARRKLRVDFDLERGSPSIPVLQLADFDGDGRLDLASGEAGRALRVERGDGSAAVFSPDSRRIEVPLPENGRRVSVADVDGDGRDDLIARYGRLDGPGADRRIRVLLAR